MSGYRAELELLQAFTKEELVAMFKQEDKQMTLDHINTLEDIVILNRKHRTIIMRVARKVYNQYKQAPEHELASDRLKFVSEAKATVELIDRNNTALREYVRELRVNPYGKKTGR